MASTYTPLATYTVSGTSTNSVSFNSISSAYTDLILVSTQAVASGSVNDLRLTINSDSGSNYSSTYLYGYSGGVLSGRDSGTFGKVGRGSTTISNMILHFNNYSNTTTYKTILERSGVADNDIVGRVNVWRSTAAISSLTLISFPGVNYTSGSTFTLYGIAAA